MSHVVKAQDTVEFSIRFEGILGADLATVAARERLKTAMMAQAAKQIEDFFADIECAP